MAAVERVPRAYIPRVCLMLNSDSDSTPLVCRLSYCPWCELAVTNRNFSIRPAQAGRADGK